MHTVKIRRNLGIWFVFALFLSALIIGTAALSVRNSGSASAATTPTTGHWQDTKTIIITQPTAYDGATFTQQSINGTTMSLKQTDGFFDTCATLNTMTISPYLQAAVATMTVYEFNGGFQCTGTTTVTVTMDNPYPGQSALPTAAWASQNPGTISFENATYTQSAINGNDMTLTYNVSNNPCATSFTMVVKNYKTATTATETDVQSSSNGIPCQTNTITVALTNTFGSAPATPPASTTNSDACPVDSNFLLRWITCPVLDAMDSTALFINNIIGSLLAFPVGEIFGPSSGFQGPFNIFRNAGLALLVIAGLVMVISQALDLTILEPYTIRKALPRIAIAIIGISLAWPLLQFALVLTNDLGYWIGSIIISVAHAQGNGGPNNSPLFFLTGDLAGTIGLIYVAGSIFAIATPGGLLALLGTILLALLIGLLVLAFRQVVIFICIMAAPLAIAASVLPGTEKLWKFWKDTFITTLIMYPIIMAFLASGAALGHIAASVKTGGIMMNFLAIILYIVPYFLIPFTFKLAGGLMSTIFSIANDRTKGPFDKLKNVREGEREWLKQQRMDEKTHFSNTRMGGLYRRFNTRGGISFSPAGEAKYLEGEKRRRAILTAKAVEDEGGNVTGDDNATNAAMHATNRADFMRRYVGTEVAFETAAAQKALPTGQNLTAQDHAGIQQRAEQHAQEAAGSMESAFGVIGGESSKLAGFFAHMKSVSSYNLDSPTDLAQRLNKKAGQLTDQDWENERERVYGQMIKDTQALVSTGKISESAGIMAIKSQQGRERAGMGFGALQNAVRGYTGSGSTFGNDKQSVGNYLLDNSLESTHPGAFMGGRKEQIVIGSRRMAEQVKQYANKLAAAQASGTGVPEAEEKYFTALADFMSKYKVTGQISNDRQQAFKSGATAIQIPNVTAAGPPQMVPHPGGLLNANGTPVMVQSVQQPGILDIWQAGEAATDKEKYRQLVYELTGRNQAALAQYQAMQQAGVQQPAPPAFPQGGPNPHPSDRRLKTDIQYLETLENRIKLYSFRYVWGGPTYVGVMAQDLLRSHPQAVHKDKYGFYLVDYDTLGLRMVTLGQYESNKPQGSIRE